MASKSKRRRRVFRASCILAALIIAGSSFAWFNSKDEVTNRLSASADYNVSIIENYVPPKQFTPGQTVKKEEGVVNTGSVDAFVKQTISGVLTVTVEVPTTEKPTNKDDYVTLSQKEFGTLEAGSTLAWKPAADTENKTGVIIGMGVDGKTVTDPDAGTVNNNAFVPAAEGLYVFRRAVQKNTDTNKFEDVSYDYVAYYYDPAIDGGTYFKVYALKVDEQKIYKEGDTYAAGHERAGEKVSFLNAGELKAEPIYTWTKTVTTTANKQDMFYETYDADDGNGGTVQKKRLKVVYDGLGAVDATITESAASSGKAEIYDAYNAYETKNLGETVYSKGGTGPYKSYMDWNTSDASAWVDDGDGNSTGLTTYDQYDQDKIYSDSDKQAHANLDNFGLDRLTNLQNETVGELNKAITKAADGTTAEDYWTLQDDARTSRRIVNEGRDAAKDLASYLSDVYSAIGQADPMTGNATTFAAATTTSGLFIENKTVSPEAQAADTFEWHAKMISDGTGITVPTYNDANGEVGLDGATEPAGFVKFKYVDSGAVPATSMAFATVSSGLTDDNLVRTMTADNVNEKRFADPGSAYKDWSAIEAPTWVAVSYTDDDNGTQQSADSYAEYVGLSVAEKASLSVEDREKVAAYEAVTSYGVKWEDVDSPVAAGSGLEDEWNKYVYQTRRLVLNLKKQELVKDAIANNGGVLTDVGRSQTEAQVYLEALVEEEANIRADYNAAKTAYETPANEVRTKIGYMNTCQNYVDAANAEYNDTFSQTVDSEAYAAKPNTTVGAGGNITEVTAAKVANNTINDNTTKDTPDENALEAKLKRIYGVAEKDGSYNYTDYKLDATDGSEYASTKVTGSYASAYSCPNNPKHTNHLSDVGQSPIYTYSVNATKNKIDANLDKDDTTGETEFNDTNYDTDVKKNAIKSAPYWKDVVTDQMKKVRKGEADAAYAAYEALLEENALRATTQQMSSNIADSKDIILYVNLANIAEDTTPEDGKMDAADRWQYMGDASDTKTATSFDFGYTGILESGEVSSYLIESVEFDSSVKQDAFKELKFDIDVALESAQAIYEGQQIRSDAAKESISNIEPSEERYANSDAIVTWVAEGTPANPAITDNDPQPKDKEVVPTSYSAKDSLGGDLGSVATPAEITPKTVKDVSGTDNITLKYAVVVKGVTYYGENKDNGTTYYALNADETGVDGTRTITLQKS